MAPTDGFETEEEALVRDIRAARYVFSQFKRVFPDERYDIPYSAEWAEEAGYFKLDIAVVPSFDPWISLSVLIDEGPRGDDPFVEVEMRATNVWDLEAVGSCRLGDLLHWELRGAAAERILAQAEIAAEGLRGARPSIPRRRDIISVDGTSFHAAMVTREGVRSWHRLIERQIEDEVQDQGEVYGAVRPLILAFAAEEPELLGYLTLLDAYILSGGQDQAAAKAMNAAFSRPPACTRPQG